MERFPAKYDGKGGIVSYQIRGDDYLRGDTILLSCDARSMKYASRIIGERIFDMVHRRWESALWKIQNGWFNRSHPVRILGQSLYEEIGILSLDPIVNVRYKLEP